MLVVCSAHFNSFSLTMILFALKRFRILLLTFQHCCCCLTTVRSLGRGGGQVVSVLTFYSDDTAEAYSFLFENNENEQKEAGAGPVFFKKNIRSFSIFSLLFFIDRKYLFSSTGILTLEVPRGHICLIFLINQNIMLIT